MEPTITRRTANAVADGYNGSSAAADRTVERIVAVSTGHPSTDNADRNAVAIARPGRGVDHHAPNPIEHAWSAVRVAVLLGRRI